MKDITIFGKTYGFPIIKDERLYELQDSIKEHRELLEPDDTKKGLLSIFVKREPLSPQERLERMESLVANYDELIKLLREKIQACHEVFDQMGEGVKAEFQRKLKELEEMELGRQRLVEKYKKQGFTDAEAMFEPQRQGIREMVTNLSRATILIIKKLRHALDALETLASDDEKQRSTYEKLRNNVVLYRETYEYNERLNTLEKQLAELTQFALKFDDLLRDNLGPLGILVEQISSIDTRLSESLADIEKLSAELEQGTFTSNLNLVSDRLISTIISGRMRADVVEDILQKMSDPLSDAQKIDFDITLTQTVTDTLDFKALAENMQILVERGIHDLSMVGCAAPAVVPAAPDLPEPEAEPGTGPAPEPAESVAPGVAAADGSAAQAEPATKTAPEQAAPQETPSARPAWVPPEPRAKQSAGGERAYRAAISRANPTLILFLLDQSGSMEYQFAEGRSRAEYLAMVVDQAIEELSVRCNKADGIRDYFYIAALGYGNDEIRTIIGTEDTPWVPISVLARSPREIYRDPEGIPHPRWLLPQMQGSTPMRAAMEKACYVVADWCEAHPTSYPPTVINITDGDPTDGSPEEAAEILRKLHTDDGDALLFNLHVGEPGDGSKKNVVFPGTSDGLGEYGKLLYRMSSPFPPHLRDAATAEGFSISPTARFFAYGAEAKLATRFLNLGTRPARIT